MILEGIVTTLDAAGRLNVAPMGPDVSDGLARFVLRPYQTSTTFRNLRDTGVGVLHITDDVLLVARAVVKRLDGLETRPASAIPGRILATTGRYHEFRVVAIDASSGRTRITAATVAEGRQGRDFFGLNRAKHAVVEAAILATRLDFLPPDEVRADFRRLAILVEKTGGPAEREAFGLLDAHARSVLPTRPETAGRSAGEVG